MAKTEHQLRVYESIVDLIASLENPTPMVRINNRINPSTDFSIYLKLERYNPFGSIKDRIALSMIDGAEIKEGQSLIEPSSGNTGIALAALANARDIPIEIAVPERIPEEKKTLLRLLGIEALWEADDKLCPLFPNEGARGLVAGMLKSKDGDRYISPNQYENELNVQAHYKTTGPEIWRQTQGRIDYFFVGFGTCGTLTGVGRYLKEKKPSVKIIGIEPAETEHNLPGMKRISDLSEDLVPKILDKSLIDETIAVEDEDAYHTGIQLARKGGILVGPTTGAILCVALQYAKEHKGLGVVISPDDAFKYVSFYAPYVKDSSKPKI
ncbi:MAG: cysteine synthase family protein [Deltaproteobacteria bacterium]|nr:cysteine synthase family protein [Deltaproteobacteria bacterium]MBW2554400.1 cysteine synthase family protein [Deltaproteobacteria bacterium]